MKTLLYMLCISLLGSCTISGFTNDFKSLNETQKSKTVAYNNNAVREVGQVYPINGIQLLNELEKHPKSLVYVFKNGCVSELCKPMAVYEDYAKNHNLKLFLVMSGYGNLKETTDQPLKSPLFVIDNEHYEVKYRYKYLRYFENEIQGLPLKSKSKEYQGNLFFYSGNRLDKIEKELPKTSTPEYQF